MDIKLRDRINKLMDSSKKELEGVELLLDSGLYVAAISRAYYGMFYVVSAILLLKGLEYSKHSSVIAAFGREFIKPGLIDRKYHKKLITVFEQRMDADYQRMLDVSKCEANEAVGKAKVFVNDMCNWIALYMDR